MWQWWLTSLSVTATSPTRASTALQTSVWRMPGVEEERKKFSNVLFRCWRETRKRRALCDPPSARNLSVGPLHKNSVLSHYPPFKTFDFPDRIPPHFPLPYRLLCTGASLIPSPYLPAPQNGLLPLEIWIIPDNISPLKGRGSGQRDADTRGPGWNWSFPFIPTTKLK